MIKKKLEYKLFTSRFADKFGRIVTRATLNGWVPLSPMVHEAYQPYELLMQREAKVTKENVEDMILLDFKDLVGAVRVPDQTPKDMIGPRRQAIQHSKAVDAFVKKIMKLYECEGTFVRDLILANLSKTTWVDEEWEEGDER